METAVNELEAMFQKAEADLEYIEKQLKSEFLTEAPESGDAEENPIKLLENLSAVKVQYKALCAQMEAISVEQKQSVESIRAYLNNTLQLVQELQQTTDIEAPPLTEKEKEAAEFLGLPLPQHAAAVSEMAELKLKCLLLSAAQSKDKFVELSKAELEAVPRSTRSNTKLADLNDFYRQLFEHFATRKNSKPLSLQQMKKMNPKVNDAMLKTLKHLSVIKMDNKGHVCLAARE
ncbi:spindle and kinetochore-associated protein 2 isoform X2 [Megalops cyprinoides]|uniref:spindle and kinetochore-associated protein 2 isoform X2 n=1 Tax=Megalops cyprinoides TaxID=118141 RepID=UPI0018650121|nr:spindle and kinetochore-associated protein 2 isoform X2 [Megalops cyprinoides]